LELKEEFLDASFERRDLAFKSGDPGQGIVEFTTPFQASRAVGGWGRIQGNHRIEVTVLPSDHKREGAGKAKPVPLAD